MSKFAIGGTLVGCSILGILIWLMLCTVSIEPGYVGMVFSRTEGVKQETLPPGWHVVGVTDRVTDYPVSTETVKYEGSNATKIATKDGKTVEAEMMYSYKFDHNRIATIFEKFRGRSNGDIQEHYMKDRLTAMVQTVTSHYGVLEIYGDKRSELNDAVFTAFKKDLEQVGIIVETFNFSKIDPDPDTKKAIQAMVDAQLKLNQLKVELDQAKVIADKAREEAKGRADSQVIEAKGQASANDLLQLSITPELIQYETAKKWDGKLSLVAGGSANQIIQVPLPGALPVAK